jgi:Galactose oxidase-like, Early set domain/Glyoxal oxidase N-terminus/Kelch motif
VDVVFFIQGRYGVAGNFEVVVPRLGGGVDHWWRDNDDPALPWKGPNLAFGSPDDVAGVSVTQSTFGSPGHLEVVFREGSHLVSTWRNDAGAWQGRTLLSGTVADAGGPALIQGPYGGRVGNFELTAPVADGGVGHWWRDNNAAGFPWHGPTRFGSGPVSGVALIHSTYGNLEVVARLDSQLLHWWRVGNAWQGPRPVASGAAGAPALIQSRHGSPGNFELVAPLSGGGMGHWWRDNAAAGRPWHGPTRFGSGNPSAVGLVQSTAGKLQVVARYPDRLEHWSRDDGGTWAWTGPTVFGVDPFTDASVYGASAVPYTTGIVAIHSALLQTGEVVLFGFADGNDTVGVSRLLDPATGALSVPAATPNAFCSGHAFLDDGRLLVAGGHHMGTKGVRTVDPAGQKWTPVADMPHGRWYPTCTSLPDGQVLAISGTAAGGPVAPDNPVNNTLQILPSGVAKEEPLPSPYSSHFPPDLPTIDLYPFVHLLPSGKLLIHSRQVTRFYDPRSHTWDATQLVTRHPYSRSYPGAGSSVLLPPLPRIGHSARVMILGGGGADPEQLTTATPATRTAEILELADGQPWAWRSLPPMAHARVMPDAVLLPDGTVLVIGGSATGRANLATAPVLPYELFDPVSETWTTLRPMHVPRLYHSSALLLPDASVLIVGKDGIYSPAPYHYPEHRAEIFQPPYLFRGPRPVITSAPATAVPGQQITIGCPTAESVVAVNLVRPGATTHSFNMGQRIIGLEILARTATTLTVDVPANTAVAVPGHHMLFLLAANGVPSVAQFVRLLRPGA